MRRILTLALAVGLLAPAASARESGEPLTIRLTVPDRTSLEWLSRQVSIDDVHGTRVTAVASPRQLEVLSAAGYRWSVVPKVAVSATMCPQGWVDDTERSWACYPTYGQYVALLEKLADEHPTICRLERLSPTTDTVRPHELLALVVSDQVDDQENEPEVLLTSSMHGDETAGFVTLLRLADELLRSYGSDPRLTSLVDDTEIWINPLANPDGTYHGSDGDVSDAIRFYTTSEGANSYVDPNRNFADPDDGDHPDGHPWWRETEAMMQLGRDQSFALSANLHGGAEVVNYPWDTFARRHADDAWFVALSRAYATLAQEDGPAGYMRDLNDGITNGWDWYAVSGGRQDWMTYFARGREVTIEMSHTKLVPAEGLPALWNANRQALVDLVAAALEGVRGVVTDPEGRPLAATIEILDHDVEADHSAVVTDPDVGDFHRLIGPGSYDLRISADGFLAEEVRGVTVIEGEATIVDVVLYPATAVDLVGVVSDADGRPVPGARVTITDQALPTATTAGDGSYRIDGVQPGDHGFQVAARGFHTLVATRTVGADGASQDFTLEAAFRAVSRILRVEPEELRLSDR